MSSNQENYKTNGADLEKLIEAAVKKVGGRKENDICRFIPVSTGGYIHHFSMRKMKYENPEKLAEMVTQYIIEKDKPSSVPPKSRAARGSRKRKDQYVFTKDDIERLLHMARLAGDKEMIRKLTPKKDLKQVKRELIASIRQGRVDQELWNIYVEAIQTGVAVESREGEAVTV